MKKEKIFGLEKNVFFIGLTSFFTDTSNKMIYSVMPLFLLSIGASKTTIGLIEGIAESTASLFKALSGYWSDKIGKSKPFMIIGYGITALITPLYALARIPVHVLFLRFFERTGKGLRAAPRDSLISGSVQKNETGKSFGFHKAMEHFCLYCFLFEECELPCARERRASWLRTQIDVTVSHHLPFLAFLYSFL